MFKPGLLKPAEESSLELTPIVAQLYGIAVRDRNNDEQLDLADAIHSYKVHIEAKYGSGNKQK
ncbi:MAG: hypothetical protein ABI035_09470 [Gemmatimonadaceae bacterium]